MPNYPEPTTKTYTAVNFELGENLPVWNQLHQSLLEGNGWVKVGKLYMKDNDTIEYTGDRWILNGTTRIEFLEEAENNKTPGENRG